MKHIHAVVLAAGHATRFQQPYNKMLAPICGKPMVRYAVDMLRGLRIPTTLVVGDNAEAIRSCMPNDPLISYAHQDKPHGTGHALTCGYTQCSARHTLVLNGDMPCVTSELIRSLIHTHTQHRSAVTFVTADASPETQAYGKVSYEGNHVEIVEAHEAGYEAHTYPHVNAGIYLFSSAFLEEAMPHLQTHTTEHEMHITHLIGHASSHGYNVTTLKSDFDTIRGVNTLDELYAVEQIQRRAITTQLLAHGVYCQDLNTTYVDQDTSIAAQSWIEPGVAIRGTTHIGARCHIGAYSVIENSTIGEGVSIAPYSHITNATIESGAHVGPFAHIRKDSHIGPESVVGNFVEVAASTLGTHTKAKHLSYIGNTTTGSHVNVGAGTIICNFDGYTKHNTHISDAAFIGSNTTLIAPVSLGSGSIIGAGSVITTDVPENALAIARERETIKENYAPHLRSKQQTQVAHHFEPDSPYQEGDAV